MMTGFRDKKFDGEPAWCHQHHKFRHQNVSTLTKIRLGHYDFKIGILKCDFLEV